MSYNSSSTSSMGRAAKRLRVSPNTYACDVCDVVFETYKQLSNHRRNHASVPVVIDNVDTPMEDNDYNTFGDDVSDYGKLISFFLTEAVSLFF